MKWQRLRQLVRSYRTKRQLPVVRGAPGSDRNDRIPGPYVLMILCLFLLTAIPAPCAGETKQLFRIGTGGTSGVYYPIGKLIAQGLTEAGGGGAGRKPGCRACRDTSVWPRVPAGRWPTFGRWHRERSKQD